MNNLLAYVEWRGDLTFVQDPFNEVDGLLFSVLSYLHYEDIEPHLPKNWDFSIQELAPYFKNVPDLTPNHLQYTARVTLPNLMQVLATSKRFQGVRLHSFVDRLDSVNYTQFSAITIAYQPQQLFVSFRGTDESIAGWREDMQMSYMEQVPAQRSASRYLNVLMERFPFEYFRIGGHSKGGNLSLYAATTADPSHQKRIQAIYNFDGPGLNRSLISSSAYAAIQPVVRTIVPKSSMIGILLEQASDYEVIDSYETGPMQHDPMTWLVKGKGFICQESLRASSMQLKDEIRHFLETQSPDERERFFEGFFNLIDSSGAKTIDDVLSNRRIMFNFSVELLKEADPIQRKKLRTFFGLFIKAWIDEQAENLSTSFKWRFKK